MLRTIHELHQSYQRLAALAKTAPQEKRERLLKVARLNLKLAQAQMRDLALRPTPLARSSAIEASVSDTSM